MRDNLHRSGSGLLTFKGTSGPAVIVLHEIYGINRHILDVCHEYHSLGYSVYCPDMIHRSAPFPYEHGDAAYAHFMNNTGFEKASLDVQRILAALKSEYAHVCIVGFSIGATVAWLAAGNAACDGIVCHYGSRIRDYTDTRPQCPSLLIFARADKAFPVAKAKEYFADASGATLEILEGGHGFCDKYGPGYCPESARQAGDLARDFIRRHTRTTIRRTHTNG